MMEKGHIKVTDEWLYKYMPVVDAAIVQRLEGAVERHPLSRACERKMKGLICREKYGLYSSSKGLWKRIAAIFVGIIGAFSLVTLGAKAFKMVYFEASVDDYGDHVIKTFEVYEDAPFVVCEPEYIPEGYELYETLGDGVARISYYQNEEGELLVMSQFKAMEGATYMADSEYDSEEIINAFGEDIGVKIYTTGLKYVYYEYGNSVFILSADNLSVEEIGKILNGWIG